MKAGDGTNLAEESAPMMPSLISPKTNRRKVYIRLWSRGNAKSNPRVVQRMCSIQWLGWWWHWNLAEESAPMTPSLISPKMNRCEVYIHL